MCRKNWIALLERRAAHGERRFAAHGVAPCGMAGLPLARQALYNHHRNAKVFS